jgi:hypothetical protein
VTDHLQAIITGLVARLGARGSRGFVPNTAILGLLAIAMGVQFALSAIRSFMLGPDHAAPRYDANESRVHWVASKVSHANAG